MLNLMEKYSLVGVIMNVRNTTAANKAYKRMKWLWPPFIDYTPFNDSSGNYVFSRYLPYVRKLAYQSGLLTTASIRCIN